MKTGVQHSWIIRLLISSLCLCVFVVNSASGADWSHWRGPMQNGVSLDTGLPDKFSLDTNDPSSNLIWTAPYGCRSTPVIMNGRVFLINGHGSGVNEGERVLCLDANTGKVIWEDKFNIFHSDIVSNRVGWTSPAGDPETGNVYIHGTQGFLRCYNRDGKIVWQHNLTEEYGRVTGYGGRIAGPLVDSGVVVVGMINASWGDFARGANRFVAFDAKSGAVLWWTTLEGQMKGTFYSNPVAVTIGGQRLMITGAADGGLHAMQIRTGKLVWSYHFGGGVINSSPVVDGNLVYCSHGEQNEDTGDPGRLLCVDAGRIENGAPKLVWEVTATKFGYASPVVVGGKVYHANDSGRLFGFDAKTGKPLGRKASGELFSFGRLSRGSPVWADGKIFIFDVNGHFHILKEEKGKVEELHDQGFRAADGTGFVETNGTPAIANGRLYVGTRDAFYCIGTKDAKAGAAPPPAPTPEFGSAPAQLQVVPADIVLHPGDAARFELRYFDANGAPVVTQTATPKVEWSIVTPPKTPAGLQPPPLKGELSESGFAADKATPGQQGYILAKVGAMTARARVRVAPRLPYKQDFEKVPVGGTPGGWVNTVGKYDVIDKDGGKMLRKLANSPNPPLARANTYVGLPEDRNYVIQADVSAQMVRDGLPDIGIVNSRYHLLLDGKRDLDDGKRRLRIASWEALPRVNRGVVFDWKPNTWYTLKLDVEGGGKAAKVRGKVWERGQAEPKDWTIEFDDPSPNLEGAPALYAYISNVLDREPGSEAYFDNVAITPRQVAAAPLRPAQPSVAPPEKSARERLAESIRVRGEKEPARRPPPSVAGTIATTAPPAVSPPTPVLGTPVGTKPKEATGMTGAALVAQAIVMREDLSNGDGSPRRPVHRYVRLNIAFFGR